VKDFIRWVFGKVGLRVIRTKNIKYLYDGDALEDFFSSLKRHPEYSFLWLGEFAFLRNGSPILNAVDHLD